MTPDAAGTGRVLSSSFLGPISEVTVGDLLVVAQVAGARPDLLAPDTPVRVTLQPVPVAVVV